MRYLWQTPHALADDKLIALLGAEPHTPLAQAVQASLVDLRWIKPPAPHRAQTEPQRAALAQ